MKQFGKLLLFLAAGGWLLGVLLALLRVSPAGMWIVAAVLCAAIVCAGILLTDICGAQRARDGRGAP